MNPSYNMFSVTNFQDREIQQEKLTKRQNIHKHVHSYKEWILRLDKEMLIMLIGLNCIKQKKGIYMYKDFL